MVTTVAIILALVLIVVFISVLITPSNSSGGNYRGRADWQSRPTKEQKEANEKYGTHEEINFKGDNDMKFILENYFRKDSSMDFFNRKYSDLKSSNYNNKLEFKLLSDNATVPTKAHQTDAGYDIYAAEDITLEPQEKAVLKTNLAVNIPKNYVGLLTSRSGVSSKTDLVIETGKIDSDYRGDLGINIKNDSVPTVNVENRKTGVKLNIKGELENYVMNTKNTWYRIRKGDKIAQLVVVPIYNPEIEIVDEFDTNSERGEKGWGSSDETK